MMEPEVFWELFAMTGEPLAYVLYRTAEAETKTEAAPQG